MTQMNNAAHAAWVNLNQKTEDFMVGMVGTSEKLRLEIRQDIQVQKFGQPQSIQNRCSSLQVATTQRIKSFVQEMLKRCKSSGPFINSNAEAYANEDQIKLQQLLQEAKVIQLPSRKDYINLTCLDLSGIELENYTRKNLDLRCCNLERTFFHGNGSTGSCMHGDFQWSNLKGALFLGICSKCSN